MTNSTAKVQVVDLVQFEELVARVAQLEETIASIKQRDRGPKSERTMTDKDAFRVKFGDLKDAKHKAAAEALGLSYGQVYSARGSYTFTHVTKDWKDES